MEAIEAKSKLLPAVAEPDPAHLVRLYVMEDGSLKPPAFKVPAGEMFALVINNYGTEVAALEIRGGSAPVKASAVSGKRTTLPLKLESGAYTIAVGGKSVPLTAK